MTDHIHPDGETSKGSVLTQRLNQDMILDVQSYLRLLRMTLVYFHGLLD
jgi:hypothetical protein